MKKVNYLFLLFAVFFSIIILFVSLNSASKSKLIGHTNLVSGKFYVAKEILPDHSLYPLLMAIDRLRLELSDSEKKVYLLVSYGNRRLFYSKKLLEKNNQALAIVTLSKAIKYTNQALMENIILLEKSSLNKKQEDQTLAFFVLENYEKQATFIKDYKDQFSDEEKAVLDSLSLESFSLVEKLRGLLKQSN